MIGAAVVIVAGVGLLLSERLGALADEDGKFAAPAPGSGHLLSDRTDSSADVDDPPDAASDHPRDAVEAPPPPMPDWDGVMLPEVVADSNDPSFVELMLADRGSGALIGWDDIPRPAPLAGNAAEQAGSPTPMEKGRAASARYPPAASLRRTRTPSSPASTVTAVPASTRSSPSVGATAETTSPASTHAASPEPTPDPGELIVSSRLDGETTVTLNGRPLRRIGRRDPYRLSLAPGRYSVSFAHESGMRCTVEARIEPGRRLALNADADGVGRLEGSSRQPTPCLDPR